MHPLSVGEFLHTATHPGGRYHHHPFHLACRTHRVAICHIMLTYLHGSDAMTQDIETGPEQKLDLVPWQGLALSEPWPAPVRQRGPQGKRVVFAGLLDHQGSACVCVCVHMCVYVRACVHTCVCVCVHV
jgi:hypothetical protein